MRTLWLWALLSGTAWAEPVTVAHQGRVMDAAGVPVTGAHAVTFSLWDQAVGGQRRWIQAEDVAFHDGYYAVTLGWDTVLAPLPSELFDGTALFLDVVLDGTSLGARQPLHAVPYAVHARFAEGVDGGPVDAEELRIGGQLIIDATGTYVGELPGPSLADLTCDDGDVVVWSDGFGTFGCVPLPDDDVSSALEVVAIVEAVPLDLASGARVDGDPIATLSDLPVDTTLTDAQVDAFATNAPLNLAPDSRMGGVKLATIADLPVDTTLTDPEVDAFVENGPIDLDPQSTIGGEPIATLGDLFPGTTPITCGPGQFVVQIDALGVSACARYDHGLPDTDSDGVADAFDPDDDGDGLPDWEEATGPTCSGTLFGGVCRTAVTAGGITWPTAVSACETRGEGNHLCRPAEYAVLFANGGLPATFPANHAWTDAAEGDDQFEVQGFYSSGTIDDWPQTDTGGFGVCCQTHAVPARCPGIDVGGVCLRGTGPSGVSFSAAATYCDTRGQRLCSAAEGRAVCAAGALPTLPSGASHWWIDAGEGDDNQEMTGMYAGCTYDDWPASQAAAPLCCSTGVRPAVASTCPGTMYNGVCLAHTLSARAWTSYAPACHAFGSRPCTAGEASVICRAGGLPAGPAAHWVDGSEGGDNFEMSGIYPNCGFDDWPITGHDLGGLCCR